MIASIEAQDIEYKRQMADALNRLANCAEADEKRKREVDSVHEAYASENRAAAKALLAELRSGRRAKASVDRGFEDLEAAMKPGFEGAAMAGAITSDEDLERWKAVPRVDVDRHDWKMAVIRDETLLGHTDWLAWKENDDPHNV